MLWARLPARVLKVTRIGSDIAGFLSSQIIYKLRNQVIEIGHLELSRTAAWIISLLSSSNGAAKNATLLLKVSLSQFEGYCISTPNVELFSWGIHHC